MNILIMNWRDTGHPKSGGAEIVTMRHATGWAKRGHAVTWLTSSYSDAPPEENTDGIRIVHKGGSFTIYLVAPLYLILNAKKYDVIVDEVHGIPFFSHLFTRKPVVVFIHEVAGDIWDYMFPYPINKIGKFLENLYLKVYRNNLFWTDATSTINELVQKGISRDLCVAIPCPISDIKPLKLKKNINPTYIFLSRVVRMKGIEEVIKAFAFIHMLQDNAVLWIVGGGEDAYLASIRKMVHEYKIDDCVRFYGKVGEDNKKVLLAQAHILLHASVKEGWGLVVLEAAAQGTPTIAYDVPGLREVVQDGKTGVIVKANAPNELAKEAVRLYKDTKRYQDYQVSGLRWVRSLNWDDAVDMSISLLHRAINTGKELKP